LAETQSRTGGRLAPGFNAAAQLSARLQALIDYDPERTSIMQIETNDWLDQEEAHAFLRKHGVRRSLMWVKLQVMYGVIESQKFWNSRVVHRDVLAKVAQAIKDGKWTHTAAVLLIACLLAAGNAQASPPDIEGIAAAIYHAEGGARGRYGIKSETCDTLAECKRICKNSVKNNLRRWQDAGKPGDFIDFMHKRYAPIDAENDPKGLNRNWAKNVRYFLRKR
jgi:hypothetical protein